MTSPAIVDSSALVAAAESDSSDNAACREALSRPDLDLVVPAMVVAEASYMIGRRLGVGAEAAFLRGIEALPIEAPSSADLGRMATLIERYADFPLGGTDASIVALAERLEATILLTLDHRHFRAVKPEHAEVFELLP